MERVCVVDYSSSSSLRQRESLTQMSNDLESTTDEVLVCVAEGGMVPGTWSSRLRTAVREVVN